MESSFGLFGWAPQPAGANSQTVQQDAHWIPSNRGMKQRLAGCADIRTPMRQVSGSIGQHWTTTCREL